MAALTASIASERWREEVLLTAAVSNSDGDVSDTIALPAGFGDCAIIEAMVDTNPAATAVADPTVVGCRAAIISPDGASTVDIIGSQPFRRQGAARYGAYFSPDPLVQWKQNELVSFVFPELDTNAVPTIDLAYKIKVVRIPPGTQQQQGPIQLVR